MQNLQWKSQNIRKLICLKLFRVITYLWKVVYVEDDPYWLWDKKIKGQGHTWDIWFVATRNICPFRAALAICLSRRLPASTTWTIYRYIMQGGLFSYKNDNNLPSEFCFNNYRRDTQIDADCIIKVVGGCRLKLWSGFIYFWWQYWYLCKVPAVISLHVKHWYIRFLYETMYESSGPINLQVWSTNSENPSDHIDSAPTLYMRGYRKCGTYRLLGTAE